MMKSFKDKNLEDCWKTGKCRKLRADLQRRVLMKLDSIDAAICIEDLQNPPGNKLHQLQGEFKGYWSICVNGPWRLVFKIQDNHVYDVSLLQYD